MSCITEKYYLILSNAEVHRAEFRETTINESFSQRELFVTCSA